MKLQKLPGSQDRGSCPDWFREGLEKFEQEVKDRVVECELSNDKYRWRHPYLDTYCGCCCIEFFYFYDSSLTHVNEYKNAIWIKVHNMNDVDIWIRVGLNASDEKKVTVYSGCRLNCNIILTKSNYSLPPNFTKKGIYVSDYNKKNLFISNNESLYNNICLLLQCLCDAKCI